MFEGGQAPGVAVLTLLFITFHCTRVRARLSKGLLKAAQKRAVANVALFHSLDSEDRHLDGLESSAILSFRDEYPKLLRGEAALRARELSANVFTLDEFLFREFTAGRLGPEDFGPNDRADWNLLSWTLFAGKLSYSFLPAVHSKKDLSGPTPHSQPHLWVNATAPTAKHKNCLKMLPTSPRNTATVVPARNLLYFLMIFLLWVTSLSGVWGQTTVVPFTDVGGLITFEGMVNGRKGILILDTGAEGLVLNGAYFPIHGLRGITGHGLFGEVKAGYYRVKELTVGTLTFSPARAQVIDLNHLQPAREGDLLGLLGYSVLKNYAIRLNYRERVVTFESPEGPVGNSHEAMDSFAFELESFLPVLRINVGGRTLRMGLDTGAGHNLLDRHLGRSLKANFRIEGTVSVRSADGRTKEVQGGRLERLLLGRRYRCAAMRTLLVNLSSLEKVYHSELDGILGREFFAPWEFTINYRKRMLYVRPANPHRQPAPLATPATPVASSRTLF